MTSSVHRRSVGAVIPVLNEEQAISLVLQDLPPGLIDEVVVVDNGSTDQTAARARQAGATVLTESQRGYGSACLRGLDYLLGRGYDIILFVDGDYSDHPEQAVRVLRPLLDGDADLVIGSRMLGHREPGAMPPQALFGNWLATHLIRLIWGVRFTDLGPFRAITSGALRSLRMVDRDYGWTVEMQIKAARSGLATMEVPVDYRRRRGRSKISGTLLGSVRAGTKILWWILREAVHSRRPGKRQEG